MNRFLRPVSRKSRELFRPEELVVKLQSACFKKLIFYHFFNVRKTERIAKFNGLEPRRCEGVKGIIVAPEIGPKRFGTFEKQAPRLLPEFQKMSSNSSIGQITFITIELSPKTSISAHACC